MKLKKLIITQGNIMKDDKIFNPLKSTEDEIEFNFELPNNPNKKHGILSYANKIEGGNVVTGVEMSSGLVMKFSNFSEGDDLSEIKMECDLKTLIDSGKIIFGENHGTNFIAKNYDYDADKGEDILVAVDKIIFNDNLRSTLLKKQKI